jgi:hypothetical protein
MLHAHVEGLLRIKPPLTWPDTVYNPESLTPEQARAVEDCVNYAGQIMRTMPGAVFQVEREVTLAKHDISLVECGGTCDLTITDDTTLHVIDWKFGKGVPVYALNNDQLYAYAAGALEKEETIYIHVVQPRLDNYDQIILTRSQLIQWLRSRVIPGVQQAYSADAPFNPGANQCMSCPIKSTGRHRHTFAQKTASDIFAAHLKLPDNISDEEITEVLQRADELQQYITDLKNHVFSKILSGQEVKGWKIVSGRSSRKWKDAEAAEAWLNSRFDYTQIYQVKLVTPPQAEKLARDVKKDEEFISLVEKVPGKPTLATESDKRPALESQTAEAVFSAYNEETEE